MSSQQLTKPSPVAGVDRALERNRAFATAGGHEGATSSPPSSYSW